MTTNRDHSCMANNCTRRTNGKDFCDCDSMLFGWNKKSGSEWKGKLLIILLPILAVMASAYFTLR